MVSNLGQAALSIEEKGKFMGGWPGSSSSHVALNVFEVVASALRLQANCQVLTLQGPGLGAGHFSKEPGSCVEGRVLKNRDLGPSAL